MIQMFIFSIATILTVPEIPVIVPIKPCRWFTTTDIKYNISNLDIHVIYTSKYLIILKYLITNNLEIIKNQRKYVYIFLRTKESTSDLHFLIPLAILKMIIICLALTWTIIQGRLLLQSYWTCHTAVFTQWPLEYRLENQPHREC